MVKDWQVSLAKASLAGLLALVAVYYIAKPTSATNWLGALMVAASVMWFVVEVFVGPKIVDDRILDEELYLEVLRGDEK